MSSLFINKVLLEQALGLGEVRDHSHESAESNCLLFEVFLFLMFLKLFLLLKIFHYHLEAVVSPISP